MLTRRKVLALALPVVAAQAATATTGLVDTLVMGSFGDKADLAAVAIAATAFSFIYWAFGFLRMSTTGLAAQAGIDHGQQRGGHPHPGYAPQKGGSGKSSQVTNHPTPPMVGWGL